MKKIELVIFDMDGLMFDTEKIAREAWMQAINEFGFTIDEEIFKLIVGRSLESVKGIYRKRFGEDFPIDLIAQRRFQIAEEVIQLSGVPVKPGLYDILSYLDNMKIKKAVATSTSRKRAFELLKLAGIENRFDYIVCGDEIVRSKPDPDIFLRAAERLSCLLENCMVLEDSEVGVQAAYNAGMQVIMIPDLKEPDQATLSLLYKRLGSLQEVKGIFEQFAS